MISPMIAIKAGCPKTSAAVPEKLFVHYCDKPLKFATKIIIYQDSKLQTKTSHLDRRSLPSNHHCLHLNNICPHTRAQPIEDFQSNCWTREQSWHPEIEVVISVITEPNEVDIFQPECL